MKLHVDLFAVCAMAAIMAGNAAVPAVECADGLAGYSIVRPEVLSEADAVVLKDVNSLLARSLGYGTARMQIGRPTGGKAVILRHRP